jgi:phosphoglycerate dehydrogenase-like enzyme
LRPGAIVINTGDMRLIDLDALVLAVETNDVRVAIDGDIGAYGEGPSKAAWSRLTATGVDRFLGGTSMAYNTLEANDRASMLAVDSVCAVLQGRPAQNVNNADFMSVRPAGTQPSKN